MPFLANSKIISLNQDIPSYILLKLTRPDGFDFQAGQYTQLFLPDLPEFPIYLSIASAPSQSEIELCIAMREPEIIKRYVDIFNSGAGVMLAEAQGSFVLPPVNSGRLIFVAGGSGVSPIRSMAATCCATREQTLQLYMGCQSAQDFPYADEFQNWQDRHDTFSFFPAVSEKGEHSFHLGNAIDCFTANYNNHSADDHFLLCGPKPMVLAFLKAADKKGISASQIITESY
ncbi:FAD-dependent oxidoreductase [Oligoflexaceae bacterium]|nr:FAD-dependent oxidoreductase [Oligoflexaceae bacterium]